MKAIHKKTGHEFLDITVIGPKVKLISKLGNIKEVSHKVFKSDYKLVEGEMTPSELIPQPVAELKEVKVRVGEILREMEPKEPELTKVKIPSEVNKKQKVNKKQEVNTKAPGGTKLKDICQELSIDPSKARKVLRSKGFGSPYEWHNKPEIEKIKNLLKKTFTKS